MAKMMVVATINTMPRRGLSCIYVGSLTRGWLIMSGLHELHDVMLEIKSSIGSDYFAGSNDQWGLLGGDGH